MLDTDQKTLRRHVRVTPALASRFDLAARIRGRTSSEALREAMEAYAEVAARNDEGRGSHPGLVQAGVGDRRDGEA